MSELATAARSHVELSAVALAVALALGIPAGAVLATARRWRATGLGLVGAARVIPSLAVLALMIPLIGVGFAPAVVALVLLAIPPIVINTDLGLRSVPAAVVDAAAGLGMTPKEIRARVEWPLALPVLFSGVRTATVEVIASATLAAFIGGGGLGELIVNGLANNDMTSLLRGAAGVGVLALGAEALLGIAERHLRERWGSEAA